MTPTQIPPVVNFVEIIPGYLQTRAQANSGLTLLGAEFIYSYQVGKYQALKLELDEWNSHWCTQAEWFYRLSLNGPLPKIMVIAYSWGAGYGFTTFANCLRDRGLEITHAVLSDPVYHWGPSWMHGFHIPGTEWYCGLSQIKAYYPYSKCTQWLVDHKMLPPRPKIVVPDNVKNVDYFIQKNSPLRGHELKVVSSETKVTRTEIKYRTHTNMDDCPEFQDRCREVARGLFNTQTKPRRQPRPKL